ncbi:MAG: EAL domain-containing protein [Geminicoccaceae bacterium]|nr:EAL domain-containing protein [Geminicoccaceae bacterium]
MANEADERCDPPLRSPLCRMAEAVATFVRLSRVRSIEALLRQRDLARRLTCCWLLALALLALGAVAATAVSVLSVFEQRDKGDVIAAASSQLARAQRLAALLPDLLVGDEIEAELARIEVVRIAERMEAVLRRLATGEPSPAERTRALRSHYFEGPFALAPRLARFLAELRALLRDLEEGRPPHAAAVVALRAEALGPLLGLLDEAVTLHEAELRTALDRLVAAALAVGGLSLALLVAIGLWIFRPMTRGLASTVASLERLSETDPLTGLANRRAVIAALERAIAAEVRLAAVSIDLDHFKEANEEGGHAAGDAILRAVAERLRAILRAEDIVGRLGGDEFVVFLLRIERREALDPIVDRIRAALHEPVEFEGRLHRVGATLGVALCPEDTRDPELLLRLADEALLRAKHEQRGTIGRVTRDDVLKVELETRLRLDLARESGRLEGLSVALQPILVANPARRSDQRPGVFGFEALARYVHPTLGPIAPATLFSAACEARVVARLGREARRVAIAAFAALRPYAPPDVRLFLNLSQPELFDRTLPGELVRALEAAGLGPAALGLEVSEEALLERVSEERLRPLIALREAGALLVLDDFGTGTSGLAQLLRLPFDLLKLDRRFVRALGQDPRAVEIVRATLGLARAIGARVVAEGVETEEQLRILRELGCDLAQGFLLAQPMEPAELRNWLAGAARRPPLPALPAMTAMQPQQRALSA